MTATDKAALRAQALAARDKGGDQDALTQALIDQGLTEDQIAKVMGGNTIRYLRETLPR